MSRRTRQAGRAVAGGGDHVLGRGGRRGRLAPGHVQRRRGAGLQGLELLVVVVVALVGGDKGDAEVVPGARGPVGAGTVHVGGEEPVGTAAPGGDQDTAGG